MLDQHAFFPFESFLAFGSIDSRQGLPKPSAKQGLRTSLSRTPADVVLLPGIDITGGKPHLQESLTQANCHSIGSAPNCDRYRPVGETTRGYE